MSRLHELPAAITAELQAALGDTVAVHPWMVDQLTPPTVIVTPADGWIVPAGVCNGQVTWEASVFTARAGLNEAIAAHVDLVGDVLLALPGRWESVSSPSAVEIGGGDLLLTTITLAPTFASLEE